MLILVYKINIDISAYKVSANTTTQKCNASNKNHSNTPSILKPLDKTFTTGSNPNARHNPVNIAITAMGMQTQRVMRAQRGKFLNFKKFKILVNISNPPS